MLTLVSSMKNLSKRKSWTTSLWYSWRSYKWWLNNEQKELKQYQDTTNKKLKKTQKQLNELREDFNKHQSKTKETLKKDIWIKEDNTRCEKEIEQKCGKPQKKRIKQKS
jgi:chromosome segregation ATPase